MRPIIKSLVLLFATTCLLAAVPQPTLADVQPGDRIDSTNWQKAEGLLPETVLEWVKKGEFILDIGELDYDPAVMMPPYAIEGTKNNGGKYDLNENGYLVEKATGKPPDYVVGIPFPDLKMSDSDPGSRYWWNQYYHRYSWGNSLYSYFVTWVNEKGMEREVSGEYRSLIYDGSPQSQGYNNPDRALSKDIITVWKPYDLAGTAMLSWRYMDDRSDNVYAYIPAIRRVRRNTPANRSDAFVGSDFCIDDVCTYDGKVNLFDWKIIGQQEVLAPFPGSKTEPIVHEKGEWLSTRQITAAQWGYKTPDWKGAQWAVTNYIWVKRPVFVLEGTPKDPYYNYGRQIFYADSELYLGYYKVIHDRADNYWKTLLVSWGGVESDDKTSMRLFFLYFHLIVDDRARHASVNEAVSPRNVCRYLAIHNTNDFTLTGFKKFCK